MVDQNNATQFTFWNNQILSPLSDVSKALSADTIVSQEVLEAYNNLQADLQQLESYKPTRKVIYEYADALPNIVQAQRLSSKALRILGDSQPVMPQQSNDHTLAHCKIPELQIVK